MNRPQFSFRAWALICIALSTLVGCSSRDVAQVSGRVQYKDGTPITGGVRVIRFEPTGDTTAEIQKAASGTIEEDGTFVLFTRKPGDGVFRGKYGVTFTVLTKAMGGESLIAPEYEHVNSTPYVVEVTDDITDVVYELEKRM